MGLRVVPAGRDGNVAYARTLNLGEDDNGEGIVLQVGDRFVCPSGSLQITLRDVDRYAKRGEDGYAELTNTVWTWLQVPPHPAESFFYSILAVSRRLDAAHRFYVGILDDINACSEDPQANNRPRIFQALSNAESLCISLNRAISMIMDAGRDHSIKRSVPTELQTIVQSVKNLRDAFEHVNERALGKARYHSPQEALSIFHQRDLVSDGVLSYAGQTLDLRRQVLPALISAREFICGAISESGERKTYNGTLDFGAVDENWKVEDKPDADHV